MTQITNNTKSAPYHHPDDVKYETGHHIRSMRLERELHSDIPKVSDENTIPFLYLWRPKNTHKYNIWFGLCIKLYRHMKSIY